MTNRFRRHGYPEGPVVYTEPFAKGPGNGRFFINTIHGAAFNQDAGFTGTPLGIHNGTDSVLWTGSNLTGSGFQFDSTLQAYTGTKSIRVLNSANNGNEALFKSGSIISTGDYVAITGAVFITRWDIDDDLEVSIRNNGVDLGYTFSLKNYINPALVGEWEKFTIGFSSFITTPIDFDEFVVKVVSSTGNSPSVHFDVVQLEESGGTLEYFFRPEENTKFHVTGLSIIITDDIDSRGGSTNPPSMPNVTYNKILGLNKLPVGILSTSFVENVFSFTGLLRQFTDFLNIPGTKIQAYGNDTHTVLHFDSSFNIFGGTPLVLDSRQGDYISFINNDDLSGLVEMRFIANGWVEDLRHGINVNPEDDGKPYTGPI